ncbi:MAG TPA: N-acetyltransferase [Terriglobales bacterium]
MFVRKAILPDATAIESLVRVHVGDGTLLPRTLAEICENVRDFVVLEHKGEIVGCGALHLYGVHLAEIRSITVKRKFRGKGAGQMIVKALMKEAEAHCVTCVCLFTRIPDFFAGLGFQFAERNAIPDKLYKDCLSCPRINNCDEIAMYQGELPNIAILAPKHAGSLVEISH